MRDCEYVKFSSGEVIKWFSHHAYLINYAVPFVC